MREDQVPGYLWPHLRYINWALNPIMTNAAQVGVYEICGAATELDYYSTPPSIFDTLADLLEPAIQALEQVWPGIDWRH